jgi:hypothetical protein
MKIDKIAVCMYGQYRSGLHLSDTIKDYFNFKGKDVDFFCSVKTYELFYNSSTETDKELNDRETKTIMSDIEKNYKPKLLNVINSGSDGSNTHSGHTGMYSAMIDSLLLKQKYEMEQLKYYDLVIMFRYDIIIHPSNYFHKLIDIIETDYDSIIDKTKINHGNFVLVNMSKTHAPDALPIIDDMCFVLTSEAADLLCTQLLMCQCEKYNFNHKFNTLFNVRIKFLNRSGHKKWHSMFDSISLPYIKFPYIWKDKLLPEFINYHVKISDTIKNTIIKYVSKKYEFIVTDKLIITPVRTSNIIPEENYTSLDTVMIHKNHWINNQAKKEKG